MAFSDILELKAMLDTGVFKSLLTMSVQSGEKHTTTVFMFQCEDVRVRTNQWKWLFPFSRFTRLKTYSTYSMVYHAPYYMCLTLFFSFREQKL